MRLSAEAVAACTFGDSRDLGDPIFPHSQLVENRPWILDHGIDMYVLFAIMCGFERIKLDRLCKL
jgi:hypothetical protein